MSSKEKKLTSSIFKESHQFTTATAASSTSRSFGSTYNINSTGSILQ
jgi:hypothetical protein